MKRPRPRRASLEVGNPTRELGTVEQGEIDEVLLHGQVLRVVGDHRDDTVGAIASRPTGGEAGTGRRGR